MKQIFTNPVPTTLPAPKLVCLCDLNGGDTLTNEYELTTYRRRDVQPYLRPYYSDTSDLVRKTTPEYL